MRFFIFCMTMILGPLVCWANEWSTCRLVNFKYSPQLEFQANIDGKKSRVGSPFKLVVKIKNIGKSQVYIYKDLAWGRAASLSLVVTDSKGRIVKESVNPDSIDRPPFISDQFRLLEPNEIMTSERWLDAASLGIKNPGVYKLLVSYHSPVSKDYAPPHGNTWVTENGILKARPVTITIKG